MQNTLAKKRRRGERVVEVATERDYVLNGKKVNKNVYELQQIYESTQMQTTKIIPEFLERIRFMVVKGICKSTYTRSVDQNGELFNYVLERLLDRIVPKYDPITKTLVTKYKPQKANLGNYILTTCFWSVRDYQGYEKECEGLVSCGEFMEDYSEVSEDFKDSDITQFKFISQAPQTDAYVPLIQKILKGGQDEED